MKTFHHLLLAIILPFVARGAETDWPRFRGPNGTGRGGATAFPVAWTTNDYAWTVKLPGAGHSSPVIVGSRLFVTCGDNATARRTILCLDPATGKTRWQRDYDSEPFRQNNDNSYATSSPAADERGVVVVWATPARVVVVALDNDGQERWQRNLGPFVSQHGFATSPLIVDDVVVVNNDQDDPNAMPATVKNKPKEAGKSFVAALDRGTGTIRWELERTSHFGTYGTPCVRPTAGGGKEIILASTAHGVFAIDPASGKLNWELPDCLTKRCVSSPVLAGDLIIVTDGVGGNGVQLIAVQASPAPKLVYELAKPLPYVPSPLILGDRMFLWGDTGTVSCHRIATGEVIWRGKVDGSFYCSPICAGNKLYCVTKSGDVIVLGTGEQFAVLGRVPLGERSHATPAVAGGRLFFRTYSQLFALGASK